MGTVIGLLVASVGVEVGLGVTRVQTENPWTLVGDDAGVTAVLAAAGAAYIAALALREVEDRRPDPTVRPRQSIILSKQHAQSPGGDVPLADVTIRLRIINEGQVAARAVLLRLKFEGFKGRLGAAAESGWTFGDQDTDEVWPTATWRANDRQLVYKGFPEPLTDLRLTDGTYQGSRELSPRVAFEIVADASIGIKQGVLDVQLGWEPTMKVVSEADG